MTQAIAVVALIALAAVWVRKAAPASQARRPRLEVLAAAPLARGSKAVVLRVDDRALLVGVTAAHVTSLADLGAIEPEIHFAQALDQAAADDEESPR